MSEATGTSDLPCFPWLADPGGLRRRVPPHRVTNGARIKVNHRIRGLVRRTMRVPTDGLGTVKMLLRCGAGPHYAQFVALFRTRPRMRAWTGVSSCIRGLVRRNGGAAAGDSSVKRCESWVSAHILSMYAPPHCCRHRWLHRPLGIHFMCSNARQGHGRLQDRLPRRGRSSRRWLCGEQSDSGRVEEAQRVGEARPGAATMGRRNYQPLRVRRPQESAIRRQEIDHRRLCEERLPTPELEIKRSERSN
jgi:hypothetical protein